tara:strand:+ start:9262 stop:10134 length:873 start_codon:yes stop_codon:yes gene_type:complete
MGAHSLGGTVLKDIAFKNKEDSLKGYTYNAWLGHPDHIGDDPRISHRGVLGDLVSLSHQLYQGKGFRDFEAEGEAGEKIEDLVEASVSKRGVKAFIDNVIDNKKLRLQLQAIGEDATPSEIASTYISENQNVNERLEKVLSRIEFKESQGKKISKRLYEDALKSLKEVEEWNSHLIEHPDYGYGGTYDYEGNPIEELLDDPAFEDTLMEDLAVVKANEGNITRLGYLSRMIGRFGGILELKLAVDVATAIHSSDNFKPRKELRENKKKEKKIKKRREKRAEGFMEQLLEY